MGSCSNRFLIFFQHASKRNNSCFALYRHCVIAVVNHINKESKMLHSFGQLVHRCASSYNNKFQNDHGSYERDLSNLRNLDSLVQVFTISSLPSTHLSDEVATAGLVCTSVFDCKFTEHNQISAVPKKKLKNI